jgi:VanZ family protein
MLLNSLSTRLYKILKENKVGLVYIPLAVYWIVIFVLTSIPMDEIPQYFNAQDKFEHFAAYFLLSFLWGLTLHFQNRFGNIKKELFMITLTIALIYGAFDELHQMFIPGRFADIFDWFADAVGSLFGSIIVLLLIRKNAVVTE